MTGVIFDRPSGNTDLAKWKHRLGDHILTARKHFLQEVKSSHEPERKASANSFRRDRRGVTAIEYALMAGFLGVTVLLAGGKVGDVIGAKLNELTFANSTIQVENCTQGKACR